jgi:hypothetical protein
MVFAISELSGGVIIVFRRASPSVPKNVQPRLLFGRIPHLPGPQDGHPIRLNPSLRSRKWAISTIYTPILRLPVPQMRETPCPLPALRPGARGRGVILPGLRGKRSTVQPEHPFDPGRYDREPPPDMARGPPSLFRLNTSRLNTLSHQIAA